MNESPTKSTPTSAETTTAMMMDPSSDDIISIHNDDPTAARPSADGIARNKRKRTADMQLDKDDATTTIKKQKIVSTTSTLDIAPPARAGTTSFGTLLAVDTPTQENNDDINKSFKQLEHLPDFTVFSCMSSPTSSSTTSLVAASVDEQQGTWPHELMAKRTSATTNALLGQAPPTTPPIVHIPPTTSEEYGTQVDTPVIKDNMTRDAVGTSTASSLEMTAEQVEASSTPTTTLIQNDKAEDTTGSPTTSALVASNNILATASTKPGGTLLVTRPLLPTHIGALRSTLSPLQLLQTKSTTSTKKFPLGYKDGITRALEELSSNSSGSNMGFTMAAIMDHVEAFRSKPIQKWKSFEKVLQDLVKDNVVHLFKPQDSIIRYYQLSSDYRSKLQVSKMTAKLMKHAFVIKVPPGPLGLSIEETKRGMYIFEIQPNSVLREKNVQVGDRIIRINDQDLMGWKLDQVVTLLKDTKEQPDRTLTLVRRAAGGTKVNTTVSPTAISKVLVSTPTSVIISPSIPATTESSLSKAIASTTRATPAQAPVLATPSPPTAQVGVIHHQDHYRMTAVVEMTKERKNFLQAFILYHLSAALEGEEQAKTILAYTWTENGGMRFTSGPSDMIISRFLAIAIVSWSLDDKLSIVDPSSLEQQVRSMALKLQVTHNAIRQYGFLAVEPEHFMKKSPHTLPAVERGNHHHVVAQMIHEYASSSTLLQFPDSKELSHKYCLYEKARTYLVDDQKPLEFLISLMDQDQLRTALKEYCTRHYESTVGVDLALCYWDHYFASSWERMIVQDQDMVNTLGSFWTGLRFLWHTLSMYYGHPTIVAWKMAFSGASTILAQIDKPVLELLLWKHQQQHLAHFNFEGLFQLHQQRFAAASVKLPSEIGPITSAQSQTAPEIES